MKLNKKQVSIFLGWLVVIWIMKLPWGVLSATITATVIGVLSLGSIHIIENYYSTPELITKKL